MTKFHCFSGLLVGRKKKSKVSPKSVDVVYKGNENQILQVKQEESINPSDIRANDTSFDAVVLSGTQDKSSTCNVKVVGDENLDRAEATAETAYEGGDEHDEILSMRRNFSDFDLQAQSANDGEIGSHGSILSTRELNWSRDEVLVASEPVIQSGHVSDPGLGRAIALWGSLRLKRSCSNIETETTIKLSMSPTKSDSYDDLQKLMGNARGDCFNGIQSSPSSVMTSCSADRVMLKKRSSSQILPSRSRKLWWKLFLWSHRNLHKNWSLEPQRPVAINESSNHKGGYSSDTIEPCLVFDVMSKKALEGAKTDLWPQNQWVAFSVESSSLDRVDAWVNSLETSSFWPIDKDDNDNGESTGAIVYPNSPKIGELSVKNHLHTGRSLAEEVVQASNIIKSLNFSAIVAHISSMGLKIIPAISAFSRLRSVDLSGNLIVHITPGSLPKSLHTLDLSRNKIATIEGLRELTRLRVLNLSYNRISRIGHGLSNFILIKELYLAGNKISEVEGLHRLLKLSVLDLSFNKITTAKALGQLVANYNSLLALNLLGNPIQSNIGDEQLRKAVSGLLPKLAYLNKQPIKRQRARGVANSDIAKAALGNSEWNSRRRLGRRPSQGSSASNKGRIGEGTEHRGLGTIGEQKNDRQRSKIRHHRTPSLRK